MSASSTGLKTLACTRGENSSGSVPTSRIRPPLGEQVLGESGSCPYLVHKDLRHPRKPLEVREEVRRYECIEFAFSLELYLFLVPLEGCGVGWHSITRRQAEKVQMRLRRVKTGHVADAAVESGNSIHPCVDPMVDPKNLCPKILREPLSASRGSVKTVYGTPGSTVCN